jgi:hypothetical protein
MFFVEYGVAPIIDQGTWIIGNKAYLPDGRVMELEQKSADVSVGRDITSTLGKGPQTRTIRWTPVLGLLLGVPMLVLLGNFLYRRFLKRKARRQEGET